MEATSAPPVSLVTLASTVNGKMTTFSRCGSRTQLLEQLLKLFQSVYVDKVTFLCVLPSLAVLLDMLATHKRERSVVHTMVRVSWNMIKQCSRSNNCKICSHERNNNACAAEVVVKCAPDDVLIFALCSCSLPGGEGSSIEDPGISRWPCYSEVWSVQLSSTLLLLV